LINFCVIEDKAFDLIVCGLLGGGADHRLNNVNGVTDLLSDDTHGFFFHANLLSAGEGRVKSLRLCYPDNGVGSRVHNRVFKGGINPITGDNALIIG